MTRQAALDIIRRCVISKVTYLARALGHAIQPLLADFDSRVAAIVQRLQGDVDPPGPLSADRAAIRSLGHERRIHGGLAYTALAHIADAGYVAAAAASTAQLLARLPDHVSAAPQVGKLCVVPPAAHEEAIARLVDGGVTADKLRRLGLTQQAIAEAGPDGSGKGMQKAVCAFLARQRRKVREATPGLQPSTLLRLRAGKGHGTAALVCATRRDKRNRLSDELLLEIHTELLGREEGLAKPCPHCRDMADTRGLHALSCREGTTGFRTLAHNRIRDAIGSTLGKGLGHGATLEPQLQNHPDVFGAPIVNTANMRADVLYLARTGEKTVIDVTIGWEEQLHPQGSVLNPGAAEQRKRATKRHAYARQYPTTAHKVDIVYVGPYGDINGQSKDVLKRLVSAEAAGRAIASETPVIKTYNSMIARLRTRCSVDFWRTRALMRIAARTPRSQWLDRGIVAPRRPMPEEADELTEASAGGADVPAAPALGGIAAPTARPPAESAAPASPAQPGPAPGHHGAPPPLGPSLAQAAPRAGVAAMASLSSSSPAA